MRKYKVMFYFGVHHVNPFLTPNREVEIEVEEALRDDEIIECAITKLDEVCPQIYAAKIFGI